MTSLIILLWACGWVVAISVTGLIYRHVEITGVIIMAILSPIFSIAALLFYLTRKNNDW